MRFVKSKTNPELYEVWIDDRREACCGENRSNWVKVDTVHIDVLTKAWIEMKKGADRVSV